MEPFVVEINSIFVSVRDVWDAGKVVPDVFDLSIIAPKQDTVLLCRYLRGQDTFLSQDFALDGRDFALGRRERQRLYLDAPPRDVALWAIAKFEGNDSLRFA